MERVKGRKPKMERNIRLVRYVNEHPGIPMASIAKIFHVSENRVYEIIRYMASQSENSVEDK